MTTLMNTVYLCWKAPTSPNRQASIENYLHKYIYMNLYQNLQQYYYRNPVHENLPHSPIYHKEQDLWEKKALCISA